MTDKEIYQTVRDAVRDAMADRYVTLSEASRLLGVNSRTLTGYVQTGVIKARVIGKSTRFLHSDIMAAGREKYSNIKVK